MKILFLIPYPQDVAPSQRYRFEQYLGLLESKGYIPIIRPFYDQHTWSILYNPGHSISKFLGLLKGFVKRILILMTAWKYDYAFIHREATPIGPPFIEWIIAKVFRLRLIYDFDDAIWLPNTSDSNKLVAKLKSNHKIAKIIGWSYKVSCGNSYLAQFAKTYHPNEQGVVLNPTTIDLSRHNPTKVHHKGPLKIGWTGSHSTLQYLDILEPVLNELCQKVPFTFVVIADQNPELTGANYKYISWDKHREVEDLLQFDIGVMPLPDTMWSKGKCGLKALQYLALGIPAVVSPVGVNMDIVEHGINGFHCYNATQWMENLKVLLKDKSLREQMGSMGRKKVKSFYSLSSNSENFLALFS